MLLITDYKPVSYLSLLYPSMREEQTSLTWIDFFFFFSSYSLAFKDMFFIAELVTIPLTMLPIVFWGNNFTI